MFKPNPANIFLFQCNNRTIKKVYKRCLDVALVSLLLTLTYSTSFSNVPIVDFEQVNVKLEYASLTIYIIYRLSY